MSKKAVIIISAICFCVLLALMICEKKYPEAGAEFFGNLIGR